MKIKIEAKDLSLWYGQFQALKDVSIPIRENYITAVIGPSGCGKSSFLRTLNRMNEEVVGSRHTGEVLLDSVDIFSNEIPVTTLRKRVGMVFQRPNPFPASIFENVAFGPKLHKLTSSKIDLENIVSQSLAEVGIKEDLKKNALSLSLEQQQRLCIARALATQPEVLLLDEPCSSLDYNATALIEDLICKLKRSITIVIVTHNMHQAARTSDFTAFFHLGEMIEFGDTGQIFTTPKKALTEKYVSGRYA